MTAQDELDIIYAQKELKEDSKWIDRFWTTGIAVVGVIVGMASFWMIEGRHFITRAEAKVIVQETAPYEKDRKLIEAELASLRTLNTRVVQSVNSLNETIKSLELSIVRFNSDINHLKEEEKENREAIKALTEEFRILKDEVTK